MRTAEAQQLRQARGMATKTLGMAPFFGDRQWLLEVPVPNNLVTVY